MNAKGTVLQMDAATAEGVEALAKWWGVSREEAVRRAVTEAKAARAEERLRALKELRKRLKLTPAKIQAWQEAILEARR